MKNLIFVILLFHASLTFSSTYPPTWWTEIPEVERAAWEILPQEAKADEVILSKRTELGVFSNFSLTPFVLQKKSFASIEGLWQSLKYPDPLINWDPRHKIADWPYTREQVEKMSGLEAKQAENLANEIYKKYGLKDVSWGKLFFDYKDLGEGSSLHYELVKGAIEAKLDQTPGLWELLMKTGCLKLRPDHITGNSETKAYRYYEIYMELRNERLFIPCKY